MAQRQFGQYQSSSGTTCNNNIKHPSLKCQETNFPQGKKNPIRNIVQQSQLLAHGFELTKNARIKLHKNGDLRRHAVYHHQFHTLEMECRWTMITADEHPAITTHTTCVIIHIQNTVLHYLQVPSSIPFVKRR
jgi:hypothetical protein